VNSMLRKYLAVAGLVGAAGAALAMLFFFPPGQYAFYPRCLFHSLTGWQCPGCGGLRAAHRLLHGDIVTAFHLNPLFVLLLPMLLLGAVVQVASQLTGRDWLRQFRRPIWVWALLTLMTIFAIARNLPGIAT